MSGNLLAMWLGVPQHDGDYSYCVFQSENKWCNIELKYVCAETGTNNFIEIIPPLCPMWPRPGVAASGLCVTKACSESTLNSFLFNVSTNESSVAGALIQMVYKAECRLGDIDGCDATKSYVYVAARCLPDPTSIFQDPTARRAVIAFGILIAVNVLCTVGVFALRSVRDGDKEEGLALLVMRCFDVVEAYRELISVGKMQHEDPRQGEAVSIAKQNHSQWSTDYFNGMRVIAMLFVIYGHCGYFALMATDYDDDNEVKDAFVSYASIVMFPAILAVDVFFFLSGFLGFHLTVINFQYGHHSASALSTCTAETNALLVHDDQHVQQQADEKPTDRRRKGLKVLRDILVAYLHRWLRLTPLMMAVFVIALYIMPSSCNGPLASAYKNYEMFRSCDGNSFWKILLYVQSIRSDWVMCVGWFWYLATDFQLYLLLPYLALGYNYSRCLIAACLVGSIMTATGLSMHYDPIGNAIEYSKVYLRMGPFLFGVVAACLVREASVRKALESSALRWAVYACSTACLVATINVTWYFNKIGYERNIPHALTLATNFVYIVLWGTGLVGVTTAWSFGHGGWLREFLSSAPLAVLSKLTFGCYLIHPVVLMVWLADSYHVPSFRLQGVYFVFGGACVWSFIGALALYLVVEHPAASLIKLLAPQRRGDVRSCSHTHI